MSSDSAVSGRTAIGKVLAVLESLVEESRLSDIARTTQLSNSTTHRILTELVGLGWAQYDEERRRYYPGSQLYGLVGVLNDTRHVVRLAMPWLANLNADTGLTVHLGMLKGDKVMYAAKLDGTSSYRMLSHVGGMVELHSTAIGKAILATWSDERVQEFINRNGLEAITPNTHTSTEPLLADLKRCSSRGWALDNGENEKLLRCVGAPIYSATGEAIGGVSVSALQLELTVERAKDVASAVRATAKHTSDALAAPANRNSETM